MHIVTTVKGSALSNSSPDNVDFEDFLIRTEIPMFILQQLSGMHVDTLRDILWENRKRVWFADLTCEGDESSLSKCAHRGLGMPGDCNPELGTLAVQCGEAPISVASLKT